MADDLCVHVGVIYNSSVSIDINALENKLSEFIPLYNDVILTGDFNIILSNRSDIVHEVVLFK